jgi:hypothetical protein
MDGEHSKGYPALAATGNASGQRDLLVLLYLDGASTGEPFSFSVYSCGGGWCWGNRVCPTAVEGSCRRKLYAEAVMRR